MPDVSATDLSRSKVMKVFAALDDAGFDVTISARTIEQLHPPKSYPLRATVRPLNRETLDRLAAVIEPFGLDYSADSLTGNFSGGVTFLLFPKGARSVPV